MQHPPRIAFGRGQPGAPSAVRKTSKGLQLTLQASELVSVKQPKDQLRDALGRPCRRNQFLDRISNPILGSSTRASFAGRQQVASGFSQTRIAMMAETGEMVGASFLSICVTVGAASFGPPKTRNLLSSALPFNVVAPLFFWWVWRCFPRSRCHGRLCLLLSCHAEWPRGVSTQAPQHCTQQPLLPP